MEGQEDLGTSEKLGVSAILYLSLVFLAFLLALAWAPCQSIILSYVKVEGVWGLGGV